MAWINSVQLIDSARSRNAQPCPDEMREQVAAPQEVCLPFMARDTHRICIDRLEGSSEEHGYKAKIPGSKVAACGPTLLVALLRCMLMFERGAEINVPATLGERKA